MTDNVDDWNQSKGFAVVSQAGSYWRNVWFFIFQRIHQVPKFIQGIGFSPYCSAKSKLKFNTIICLHTNHNQSFGFGLKSEYVAGFDVKSETESLNRFIFGFGPNPEVKYPNPESFLKRTELALRFNQKC